MYICECVWIPIQTYWDLIKGTYNLMYVTKFTLSTLAPLSNSSSTTSLWPFRVARWRGVIPSYTIIIYIGLMVKADCQQGRNNNQYRKHLKVGRAIDIFARENLWSCPFFIKVMHAFFISNAHRAWHEFLSLREWIVSSIDVISRPKLWQREALVF